MSTSYNYDYSPLSTNHKARQRRAWFWPACFAALVIVDVAVFWFYPRAPPRVTPLDPDNFQPLYNASFVNTTTSPPLNPEEHAVVSSLYTDAYATAVSTLGHSLKAHNTTARMILMYIPDRLSDRTKCLVTAAGWTLHQVPFIPPPHDGKGIYGAYRDQYTKLNLWTLDSLGLKSVVYLDADTLVRRNFDELFFLPFSFAAVPDVLWDERGYTIAFNAGVMLLRPSTEVFNDMLSKLATARYPPRFAEQAFLNVYFSAQAVRLPYVYNGNLAIKQRTPALWDALTPEMRVVHYTLAKPFPTDEQQHSQEEFESFVHASRGEPGSVWDEPISWWEEAWKNMEGERQALSDQCA